MSKAKKLLEAGSDYLASVTRSTQGSSLHSGFVKNQMAYDQALQGALDELQDLKSRAEKAEAKLEDIRAEVEGCCDGAPDANAVAKQANTIMRIIEGK